MVNKLSESAHAALESACDAYGVAAPAAGGDLDAYVKATAKDEIMAHDLSSAIDAAARFDLPAMNGALASVRSFYDPRDVPVARRARDLAPGA
jgi:hypothetical protein